MSYKISNKKLLKRIMNFPINSKLTLLIHICGPLICVMLIILKFYYKQEKRISNMNLISLTFFSFFMIRIQYMCITMKQLEIMCQVPVMIIYFIFYISYVFYIITILVRKKKRWELYDKYDKIVIGYFIIASLWILNIFIISYFPKKK